MDLNKIWLSGLVTGELKTAKLPNGTTHCSFEIEVKESYLDREGEHRHRKSYFTITNFGKTAEKISQLAKQGSRVIVEGYLRSEVDSIGIRSYAVYLDRTMDINFQDGLRQALKILRQSKDIKSAKESLEQLIKEKQNGFIHPLQELPGGGDS